MTIRPDRSLMKTNDKLVMKAMIRQADVQGLRVAAKAAIESL
jgi:hypothetical protein